MLEINCLKSTLKQVRVDVAYHSKWFSTVTEMYEEVGTTPCLPRICHRQCHQSNTHTSNPCDYFRRTIAIPMLDHLLAELEAIQSTSKIGSGRSLLSATGFSHKRSPYCVRYCGWTGKAICCRPPTSFLTWQRDSYLHTKWKSEEATHSLPTTLSHTLPKVSNFFSNIKVLITILCTLPLCTAERSFSGLKCIKTSIRSSMSNERLSNLAHLHIHPDIPIDIDEVFDIFARRHPRHMRLS